MDKQYDMDKNLLNVHREWSCPRNYFLENRRETNNIYHNKQSNTCIISLIKAKGNYYLTYIKIFSSVSSVFIVKVYERMCLMMLCFKRYFSHYRALVIVWEKYPSRLSFIMHICSWHDNFFCIIITES